MPGGDPFEQLLAHGEFPERTKKPRSAGITIVLDKGLGRAAIADLGEGFGDHCDFAKIAWASALATRNLEAKVRAYREQHIAAMLGGTLFEWFYLRGRTAELLDFVRETKLHLEISDGVATIPRREKLRAIETFAAHTEVFSELGRKTGAAEAGDWPTMIREDLSAGAKKLVIEGREIGPSGKEIRTALLDELAAAAPLEVLVFEALERYQQIYLIDRFGPNVNLGNILPGDVLTVEAFRRGLKEQTLLSTFNRRPTPPK